ncbi:MAG: peptidoglycan editing factor PgeF [Micropepsaceae bacterium]
MNVLKSRILSEQRKLAHGFYGRPGGVSSGVYASLNCGYGSGDNLEAVRTNRGLVAKNLGADPDKLLTVYQVHSAAAVIVTASWSRESAPHADGMVTNVPGIALGVLAADCAPVLFADESAGVIGSAHAGWQGAIKGIVETVVQLMEQSGASRTRLKACVGPCISQKNYEVGPEFRQRFCSAEAMYERFFVPAERDAHWMFDLPRFVRSRLEQSGVQDIEVVDECTYANAEVFFSYRRTTHRGEQSYGRNMSAIVLVP